MEDHYSPKCPLCRLTADREIITPLHYEDELIMVVDCLVCKTPMAVLKAHRARFSPEEREYVRSYFQTIGQPGEVIDWEQRQIPDHAHCHLRPHPFRGTIHWQPLFDTDQL